MEKIDLRQNIFLLLFGVGTTEQYHFSQRSNTADCDKYCDKQCGDYFHSDTFAFSACLEAHVNCTCPPPLSVILIAVFCAVSFLVIPAICCFCYCYSRYRNRAARRNAQLAIGSHSYGAAPVVAAPISAWSNYRSQSIAASPVITSTISISTWSSSSNVQPTRVSPSLATFPAQMKPRISKEEHLEDISPPSYSECVANPREFTSAKKF